MTFYFAGMANTNSGVIASIFSTCVAFTAAFFFFLHGQKLTKYDIIGCTFVIGSVVLIGFGNDGP